MIKNGQVVKSVHYRKRGISRTSQPPDSTLFQKLYRAQYQIELEPIRYHSIISFHSQATQPESTFTEIPKKKLLHSKNISPVSPRLHRRYDQTKTGHRCLPDSGLIPIVKLWSDRHFVIPVRSFSSNIIQSPFNDDDFNEISAWTSIRNWL